MADLLNISGAYIVQCCFLAFILVCDTDVTIWNKMCVCMMLLPFFPDISEIHHAYAIKEKEGRGQKYFNFALVLQDE